MGCALGDLVDGFTEMSSFFHSQSQTDRELWESCATTQTTLVDQVDCESQTDVRNSRSFGVQVLGEQAHVCLQTDFVGHNFNAQVREADLFDYAFGQEPSEEEEDTFVTASEEGFLQTRSAQTLAPPSTIHRVVQTHLTSTFRPKMDQMSEVSLKGIKGALKCNLGIQKDAKEKGNQS